MGHNQSHNLSSTDHPNMDAVFNLKDFGAVGNGTTDDSGAITALKNALPASTGALVLVPPGRYRMVTEVDFSDIATVKFEALSGKRYQGRQTTAVPLATGGTVFEGGTPGMTMLKFQKFTNADATHQGPTFEGIGFQDGRWATSRQTLTSVALFSGTTYTYTISGAGPHGFVGGESVHINGVSNASAPFGTLFNGHYQVANSPTPTATQFSVDIKSNPSTVGLTYGSAQVNYAPSMTLLNISQQTRARLRDCSFSGGLIGLKLDPVGADVSWANLYGCIFTMNDIGIYGVGGSAQSISIHGGDFQIANAQIGVDFPNSNTAMFKMRDFKLDTLYNDGQGCIGIRLGQPTQYMIDGSFENDGPCISIQIGASGASYGRVSCSFQANNTGTKTNRVGNAVEIGVPDTNTTGSTTNGSATITLTTIDVNNYHSFFKAFDAGKLITGTGIPVSTFIGTVVDSKTATLVNGSNAAVNATSTTTGNNTFLWSAEVGNVGTNLNVSEITLTGSTFVQQGTAVNVGALCRGVTIMGGSQALCDKGINVQAGAEGTTIFAFKRRRAESGSDTTFANHIVDAGTHTQQIFCNNVTTPGGIVPVGGTTTMTTGFVYVSSGAGPPTGVPTLFTGTVPSYVDTTNLRVYYYIGGLWKSALLA